MRRIAATAGLAGALLTAGTAAVDAATQAASPDGRPGLTAESVDRYVRDYMRRTDLPGAVVTVVKDDKVVYAAGHGHTAGGEAIAADTPMPRR